MSQHRFQVWAAVGALLVLVCLGGEVLTARQEPTKPNPQPLAEQDKKGGSQGPPAKQEKKKTEGEIALDKMFEAFDLKPHGLPAIPDNPPPHEGAMIDYPIVIEPPDLVLIEVLEALPGRPISGERLVRNDGSISLGFYGQVHVAGLSVEQAKVKIIMHLRKYLSDEGLGLHQQIEDEEKEAMPELPGGKVQIPEPPGPREKSPFDRDEQKPQNDQEKKPHAMRSDRPARSVRHVSHRPPAYIRAYPGGRVRFLAGRQEKDEKKPGQAEKPVEISLESGGKVTVTIEVDAKPKKEEIPIPEGPAAGASFGPPIDPKECDRVFVDVSAFNSKTYYVMGDVAAPGRLPFTDNETVLDALHFAGGLLPTAESKDIHLVRPARGGKPAKVYEVDLEAIRDKGEVTTNYQIFPGDRLVVGRNEVVKKTTQLDRVAAPLQTAFNSILQESFMLRSVQFLSPDRHDQILKNLVEFWVQELNRPEGAKFDENTLRDVLIKRLQIKP